MGAIAGAIHLDTLISVDVVTGMLAGQRHRAPGSEPSIHLWRGVQLGSLGASIEHNRRGTVCVAVDGSLNGRDRLREKLRAEGLPVLADATAGEMILKAYERWNRGFAEHVGGHVSIALLDKEQRMLILVRDRLGRKPLYWFHSGNTFLFSSELKGLLLSGSVPQHLDRQALATHLALGYFPEDLSPIAGVSKLLSGHFIEFHLDGHKRVVPYWSCSEAFARRQEHAEEGLHALLQRSLKERADRFPRMGCYLGGGLGSSAIATYAAEAAPGRLEGYATVFAEQNEDDGRVAQRIASHLEMPMHLQTVHADEILHDLPKIVWHLEEPVALANLVSTWNFAKQAQNEKVVLSGMGSDELLGGHTRYQADISSLGLTRHLARLPKWLLQQVTLPLLEKIAPRTAYRVLRHTLTEPDKVHHLHAGALFDERTLAQAAPDLAPLWDMDIYLQRFFQHTRFDNGVEALLYLDTKTRLIDSYILHFERLTAAFGLEWQAPFLDAPTVEFLLGVPAEAKCTAEETAIPLRRLMHHRLPEGIVQRRKLDRRRFLMGWARQPRLQAAFASLASGTLAEVGLLSRRWVERTLLQVGTDERAFDRLWACLLLETWFRIFINQPLTTSPPTMELEELLGVGNAARPGVQIGRRVMIPA